MTPRGVAQSPPHCLRCVTPVKCGVWGCCPGTWPAEVPTDTEVLRVEFEKLVGDRDSYGLRRSRRGTYVNPAIARDWKWFQLGADARGTP